MYTSPIDAYYDYSFGALEYRSVHIETEVLDTPNFQGNVAVNYTDAETPYTRIIEHKWFEFGKDKDGNDLPQKVISREYSSEWKTRDTPTIGSMMKRTMHFISNTRSWQCQRRMSFSVVVWENISIMIWMR